MSTKMKTVYKVVIGFWSVMRDEWMHNTTMIVEADSPQQAHTIATAQAERDCPGYMYVGSTNPMAGR